MNASNNNDGHLTWKAAATVVLRDARRPLHYQEIYDTIVERGLRERASFGSTTVNGIITESIKIHGESSPFVRTAPGTYILRETAPKRGAGKKS